MAEFDLAAVLSQAAAVPAGSERIEYIPYQRIHEDMRNFYSIDGIEELAANIEMIGLQQPIRVKKIPGSEKFAAQYRVVSGHRRLAAWRKLDLNCPGETYRNIPAIVEPERDEPEALQQLRLIFANSDTRKMTGRDLQQQAQRVKALLEELKAGGYEFRGRMRDQVAQICGVSKSKLSRLDAIKNKLHPGIYNAYYQTSDISETAAYEISKLPVEEQANILRKLSKGWKPTTEKILQYIEDRKAAKLSAEKEAEEELNRIRSRIREDYEHLTVREEDVPIMGTIPEPEENVPIMGTIPKPDWLTGDPPGSGLYWCKIRFNDGVGEIHQCLVYQPEGGGDPWRMKNGYGIHDTCEVAAWWPIPED